MTSSVVYRSKFGSFPRHHDRPRSRIRSSWSQYDYQDALELEDLAQSSGHQNLAYSVSEVGETSSFVRSREFQDDEREEGKSDSFQREVARKTQRYLMNLQQAEIEVMIDRIVAGQGGSLDKALIHVVAEEAFEAKVQTFTNILLHRGASPSSSDENLCTPLHYAAKRGFVGVTHRLLYHGALPLARDKDNNLPLKTAIASGNDQLAAILVEYMRNVDVRALFTSVNGVNAEFSFHHLLKHSGMQKTVLTILDCMIEPTARPGYYRAYYQILESDCNGRPPNAKDFDATCKSSLQIIAKQGNKDIVYHDIVRLLLRKKWKDYAQWRFQLNSIVFVFTQIALTFSVVVACDTDNPTLYDSPLQIARAVTEVWAFGVVFVTLFIELNQMRKLKLDYWVDQFNWLDILSVLLLLAVIPLRYLNRNEQWAVYSIGYLLWTLRIFKYAAIFRQTGSYAQILWKIIAQDFIQFAILFSVVLLTFSGSFLLALRGDNELSKHNETSTFWNILFTGARTLIDGEKVVEYFGDQGYSPLGTILMVIYLLSCSVVLLNILIAQLSDTYQHIQSDAQRSLECNRAWIVARVELNSLAFGRNYRSKFYKEIEEIYNPKEVLEKWESPQLNDYTASALHTLQDTVEAHELHMVSITKQLAKQDHLLKRIQNKLDMIVSQGKPEQPAET